MRAHSPFNHPAERLVQLTMVAMLDAGSEAMPQALAMLEAAVAEVFMGDPSGWSVESVERLLGNAPWLERAARRAGMGVEVPELRGVREMVAIYRAGQRERFRCGAPTPLWPWVEIKAAGEPAGARRKA